MLGRGVGMVATFLLSVLFANLLPKETYGVYKYVISVIGILGLSTLSGMGTAMTRAVAQGNDGSLKPAIWAEMKWGLLGSLASFTMAAYYWFRGDTGFALTFLVVGFFMPVFNVFSLYGSVLNGKKRFDLAVRYDVYTQFINFGLMVPFLIFTRDVYVLILPYLLVNSLVQALLLKRTTKQVTLNDKVDPAAVSYGKNLSVMDILSALASVADQLLIYHFLGPVQLAVYHLALAPTEQIKGVIKMVGQLAFPKFAEQSKEVLGKAIFKKVGIFTIALVPIVAAYIIAAPWLFKILFPAYASSVVLSQVLCFSLLFAGSMLLMQYLQSQSMSEKLYKYNFINLFLEIGVIFFLVYFFGLWGAVVARVTLRFLNLMVLAVFSRSARTK